jgi:hypothetical protein
MDYIFNRDFIEFMQALNKQEVEYLIVGGYSVIIHGYSRTTGDLDVWVNKTNENYRKIERALLDFGMPVFDMTLNNFMNSNEFDVFTFGRPPIAIDIMTEVKGLTFSECFNQRLIKKLQETHINVLSKKDLLNAKRASNRSKDQNDIDHLD